VQPGILGNDKRKNERERRANHRLDERNKRELLASRRLSDKIKNDAELTKKVKLQFDKEKTKKWWNRVKKFSWTNQGILFQTMTKVFILFSFYFLIQLKLLDEFSAHYRTFLTERILFHQ